MRVLVTGGGAREHALGFGIANEQGGGNVELFFAPGNPGTAELGTNLDLSVKDIEGQASWAKQNADFVVVGPDGMLADGMGDACREAGVPVFGHTKDAARLETSKGFAKGVMDAAGIRTAAYERFDDPRAAEAYLGSVTFPRWIKADGLAEGKGAVAARSLGDAMDIIQAMMVDGKYGPGGKSIVIEEDLGGHGVPEISLHSLTDGVTSKMLPLSKDHKPIFDNDQGENTGGMGTVSPLPGLDEQVMDRYSREIIDPFIDELRKRGIKLSGLLYPSIKLRDDGAFVVEWNARFGDPEAQVHARRVRKGFLGALIACSEGGLSAVDLQWRNGFAACVVLAAEGYPESGRVRKGDVIEGVYAANRVEGVHVFHAGTARKDGQLVTNGGRVLSVTAVDDTLEGALARAYEGASQIYFPGMQFRGDIGRQALQGIRAT